MGLLTSIVRMTQLTHSDSRRLDSSYIPFRHIVKHLVDYDVFLLKLVEIWRGWQVKSQLHDNQYTYVQIQQT